MSASSTFEEANNLHPKRFGDDVVVVVVVVVVLAFVVAVLLLFPLGGITCFVLMRISPDSSSEINVLYKVLQNHCRAGAIPFLYKKKRPS